MMWVWPIFIKLVLCKTQMNIKKNENGQSTDSNFSPFSVFIYIAYLHQGRLNDKFEIP